MPRRPDPLDIIEAIEYATATVYRIVLELTLETPRSDQKPTPRFLARIRRSIGEVNLALMTEIAAESQRKKTRR